MLTTIVGKDAPLETSIEHFKNIFQLLGLEITEKDWLNPIENVYSVHIELTSCPSIYSNGKGSSEKAALASAYGELCERLATHMCFSDYYLGYDNSNDDFVHFKDEKWTKIDEEHPEIPNDILNASLRKFYSQNADLSLFDLVDVQASSFERGVCSIPFTNARNGEIVYFPVHLLTNLYGSNGMSAGNTQYEALVQGLSEIVERYTKREILRYGFALPQIPDSILRKYPKSYETLQILQSEDIKVLAYDASLGGRFPVVCIVLFNQRNGTTLASFGAHPIFEVALDRTVTELLQGRSLSDVDDFDEPTFSLDKTADPVNIESQFVSSSGLLPISMFKSLPDFKFVPWDFSGSTYDQYKALRYIIDKLGFDVYIRAYPFLGVNVYRTIVPGMSEIYPLDDLVYNNTNRAIDFQESLLLLPECDEDEETFKSYLGELESEDIANEELVCSNLGILPEEKSAWETLRFGELKCLIALKAKDYGSALNYANWTINFNRVSFTFDRLRFYQCLIKVLECLVEPTLNLNDYKDALRLIYSKETFERVLAHVNGTEQFYDLNASDLNLKGFLKHQALIDVYKIIKEQDLKYVEKTI